MCLVKGDFALALLSTEPEGAEQAEEDVHEQEYDHGNCVSHSIVLELLVIASDVLERTDITDIDVSDAKLLFAVRFQAFDEIHVLVGTDTDAEFLVVIHIVLLSKMLREVRAAWKSLYRTTFMDAPNCKLNVVSFCQ